MWVNNDQDAGGDYLHNLLQLCLVNATTPILIIHFKSPFQFMLQLASQYQVQGCNIFQKINSVVLWKTEKKEYYRKPI